MTRLARLLKRLIPILLLILGCWACSSPQPPPPLDATCAELAANPTYYAGRRVRVSTADCQRTEDGKSLCYRQFASDPPLVRLDFPDPIPDPVPEFVVGTCHAPIAGGPVTVAGCTGE